MFTVSGFLQILGFMGLVAAAVVYLKSNIQKSKSAELLGLAEVRGERIDDLEKHIERLEKAMNVQKKEMAERLAHLQGQLDAALGLKSDEIVAGVLEGLQPYFAGR